jgi:ferrochelatase
VNITSVVDILNGELKNSPFISFIYSFKSNISKIKEGDLFFAKNKSDIQEAVSKGAFCIVYDFDDIEILDDEIAWIKVSNLQKSIYSFIRYKLALKNLNAYYCDSYSFYLLKEQKFENTFLLNENLDKFISNIDDIYDNCSIFSNNEELLKSVYPNYNIFNKKHKIENFIEHSMFETSFTLKEDYFQRIRVPKLYINSFLDVYFYSKENFDSAKIKNSNYFKPIFIDKKLNIVEHGRSEKFILCQEDIDELNSSEIKFLNKHFSYGKTIYLSKKENSLLSSSIKTMKNIKELKNILETNDFNACYIIGYSYNSIIKELEDTKKELTLF